MKTHCYENWANKKVYKDNMADNVGISSATEICCSIVCELRVVILPLEINLEEKFKTCMKTISFGLLHLYTGIPAGSNRTTGAVA